MNSNLTISIVQTDLVWENIEENLQKFDKIINSISGTSDIIILPEMFSTGFSMNPEKIYQATDGKVVEWMKQKAAEKNSVIAGSVIIKENNAFFNRFIWMQPDGNSVYYDKRHLFRMSNEHHHYNAGEKMVVINFKGWRIKPLICYDLRFPVWSRNQNDYDMLIYVANWPHSRSFAWKTLLTARAIENQAFVVGVNRIGKDFNHTSFSGDSIVIHPLGNFLIEAKPFIEEIHTVTIHKEDLEKLRETFPVSLDADNFKIIIE